MLRRKHNWSGFAEYMKYEELEKVFLDKPGAWLDYPFGQEVAVFKIGPKMFGFIAWNDDPLWMNLKCDPERAIELRDEYPDIVGGWHMNKKHWNTVFLERELPDALIRELIDHSYELVTSKLKKVLKEELAELQKQK